MSWELYEVRLIAKNDPLRHADAKMTLTAGEFLKRLRGAYEAGRQSVIDQQRAAKEFAEVTKPYVGPNWSELFGFGK